MMKKVPTVSEIVTLYEESMKRDKQKIESMQRLIDLLEEKNKKLKNIIIMLVNDDTSGNASDSESVCGNF